MQEQARGQGVAAEILAFLGSFFRGVRWWLLLLPLAAILSGYLARRFPDNEWAVWWLVKGTQETIALVLLGTALTIFARRYFHLEQGKPRLTLILMALTTALLCREIHFVGTHRGIWVALVLIVLWVILWFRDIKDALIQGGEKSFLTTAFCCYLLSQLVERRVFKPHRLPILPDEKGMHVILEEILENVGHAMILGAAIWGIRREGKGTSDRCVDDQ